MTKKTNPYSPLLGKEIDAHFKLYQARKRAEQQLAEAKQREHESSERLLKLLGDAHLDGARGKAAQISKGRHEFVEIKDYLKLCAFIRRKNAFDLLHQRVTISALRDRFEAGEKVPGVLIGSEPVLNLSAVKK